MVSGAHAPPRRSAQREIPGECDVAIVGAGAAGCLAAAKFARAGRSVVVLEAGPAWRTGDLVSSQLHSRHLRGPYVTTTGAQPIAIGFNSGWGYGGAALHHYAVWPRLHAIDFKLRANFGDGLDWPFEYETLRPFYDRIQAEVGLSGDARAEVWRPPADPYPMGPLEVLEQGETIRRGFEKLGVRTAPVPAAINSRPYAGRAPCVYDGWCDAGCPIGALANPLVTYMPQAERAGARFFAGVSVERIDCERADRVNGLRYTSPSGASGRLRARLVISAASPVGNSELLLRSTGPHHPFGLGNHSGMVGRCMMTHAALPVYGMFREHTAPYRGISGAQLIGQDAYRHDGEAGYQWLIAQAMKPNDVLGIGAARSGLTGGALTEFMHRGVHHLGSMLSMAEAIPVASNRITIVSGRPVVTHAHPPKTLRAIARIREQGLALMRAAGAEEFWSGSLGSAHIMGGTIMGENPMASVTDSFGRVHGLENLYVVGASVFPTGGAVNPTFTVHATTLRTVTHLIGSERGIAARDSIRPREHGATETGS